MLLYSALPSIRIFYVDMVSVCIRARLGGKKNGHRSPSLTQMGTIWGDMSGGHAWAGWSIDWIFLIWLADRFSDFFEQAADSKS